MMEILKPESDYSNGRSQMQELAARYGMTREEMELIVYGVQQKHLSLEWLKQPRAQQIVQHRKGRWVHEEEQFADFLCKEFCMGLSEIDEGTTKRAYLSSKLACTKMRISKKFKGKNSGKEVFKKHTSTPDGLHYPPLEIAFYKERHAELEKLFIKSVLKSEINGYVKNLRNKKNFSVSPRPPLDPQPTSHGTPLPNASSRRVSATISPTNGVGSSQKAGLETLAPSQKGRSQLNRKNNVSTGMNDPVILSRSSSDGMPPDSSSHQKAKSSGVYIRPAPDFASSQAQACLSFFPSNPMENQGSYRVSAFTYDNQDVHVPGDRFDGHGFTPLSFPLLPESGIGNRFKTIPTATAPKAVSATPSEPSPTTTNLSSLNENSFYSNNISRRGGADAHYCDNGMPDLLLGFDNHVAFMKQDTAEHMTHSFEARLIPEDSHFFAGAGCIGESPFITSRSFNELHRHLGIGLSSDKVSHLDLNHHQGTNAKVIVPTASSVSKQGRLLPDSFGHVSDFPQSQPHMNGFHQYPSRRTSCSSDLSTSD